MPSLKTTAAAPAFAGSDSALQKLLTRHPEHRHTVQSLRDNGFAIIDPGFDPDDLRNVQKFCSRAVRKNGRVPNGWKVCDSVAKLAVHQPILDTLSAIYGRRAFPFQTLNFEYGTQQGAHADTYHFNAKPDGFMCGVWVALEDVSRDAGPLFYYPGSHKLETIERLDLMGGRSYRDYEARIAATMESHGLKRETALLKRGQALIWAANLVHGGAPRINPALTRLSQVTHYFFDECAYYTPLEYNLKRQRHTLRQPYDLARRRFVKSDRAILPGRSNTAKNLFQRVRILVRPIRRLFQRQKNAM